MKKVGATTWILHLNYQLVLHLTGLNMDQIISVIKLSRGKGAPIKLSSV